MTRTSEQAGMRGSILVGLSAVLLLASAGMVGGYFWLADGTRAQAATAAPAADTGAARVAANKFIAGSVTLTGAGEDRSIAWSALGATVDDAALTPAVAAIKGNSALAVALDHTVAEKTLRQLKQTLDQAPGDARLDLEARTVVKARAGRAIDVHATLAALEFAARAGMGKVELVVIDTPATRTVQDLGIDDISHVLAKFTTRFAINDKARNYNLKLAASKLNGFVLQPGQLFSFNETVGARTEKEGYKIAHVITAGEMVDGLAGGTCQISTTLHGAAFFSGIEIVRSTPHSRPSTYVQMGLDATVVYPHTDLKLRNSYDFPVVIHYRVARGESTVIILGRERPYDKIAFEREVGKEIPFDTITREDDSIPVGSMSVEQSGFPGYKVTRYRRYYKNGKVVKSDRWKLRYRPVTEYLRTGTNPDPNLAPPKQRRGHGPRAPTGKHYRLVQ